jgi:hypothetical protein
LEDINTATVKFSHQVDRNGVRVVLGTEESSGDVATAAVGGDDDVGAQGAQQVHGRAVLRLRFAYRSGAQSAQPVARVVPSAGARTHAGGQSTGVTNSVNIQLLEGSDNDLAEARGAALAVLRSRVYRQLERRTNQAWRERVMLRFSGAHLAKLREASG